MNRIVFEAPLTDAEVDEVVEAVKRSVAEVM